MLFSACSKAETTLTIEEDEIAAVGKLLPETVVSEEPEPLPTAEETPDISPSPYPTVEYEPEPIRATVVAAGDLMCLYAQLLAARKGSKHHFDHCFAEIKERVSEADIAIGNLETLVAKGYKLTGPSPETGGPKINAPETFLSAVVGCGFDVLINANNHIYDYNMDGLNKTIKKLEEYGVYHTGAYATGAQRDQLIMDVKGINIAVLGYTDFINGSPRVKGKVDKYSEKLVSADIKAAREKGADFVIVYMHWGKENTHKITKRQKSEAVFLANAGADIIIGSHSHCVQEVGSIETKNANVPVFYSLGNLISSMGRTINKDSALVNITLEKNIETGETKIFELTYTPTLCTSTAAGSYVVLPADDEYISRSGKAKALKAARKRIIKVMGETVAQPE